MKRKKQIEDLSMPKLERSVVYKDIVGILKKLICEERLWGKFLMPERELAQQFGVSRETLRRSLAILQTEGIITRRQGSGTYVLSRETYTKNKPDGGKLILVCTQVDQEVAGGHVGEILAGIASAASIAGHLISFVNVFTPAGHRRILNREELKEVDGILLVCLSDRKFVEKVMNVWEGPLVLADHHFDDLPITGVVDDSEYGIAKIVEHFVSLGHRRIAYIEVKNRALNPWRYNGYVEALEAAGIELDPQLVRGTNSTFSEGRDVGGELLDMDNPPTAILTFDDIRAWGVWRAAEDRGMEVGKDIAIAGFGDRAARTGFPDDLTSVHVDNETLGKRSLAELEALIDGNSIPGGMIRIPVELIVRKSSAEAKRN